MRTRYKGQPINYTNPCNQKRWSQGGVHTNPRAQDVLADPNYPRPVSMVSKADRSHLAVTAATAKNNSSNDEG